MAKMKKRRKNKVDTPEEVVVETMLEDILADYPEDDLSEIPVPVSDETPPVKTKVAVEVVKDKSTDELDSILAELQDSMNPDELEHYSLAALKTFRDHGLKQSRTPRGNYPSARTRPADLELWSTDELLDWLEDRIQPRTPTPIEDIYDEIYARWNIPANYTLEDARNLVLNFTEAPRSEHGELINDRRREACELEDMTFAMLCSIYLEEVDTKHSSEAAYKRLKTILRAGSDEDVDLAVNSYKNGRPLMTNQIEQILYILDDRKKMFKQYGADLTDRTVADNQILFYNQLRRIMKLDYAEFAEAWRSLLRYVDNNYQELFVATRARRGWTLLDISAGNLATFDRLITLITSTRKATTRHKDVQYLKMDHILEFVLNAKERDNLLSFYQS